MFKNIKIRIVPCVGWTYEKNQPTQYSYDDKEIQVRSDYDIENDPAGWLVHEKIHALYPRIEIEEYPDNPLEEIAFSEQFEYLKNKGYTFEEIFSIPTMETMLQYKDILKKWWKE